jgi:hypothetical protein
MVVGAFVYLRDDAHLRCPTGTDVDLLLAEWGVRASRRGRLRALCGPILPESGAASGGERLTQRRIGLADGERRARKGQTRKPPASALSPRQAPVATGILGAGC